MIGLGVQPPDVNNRKATPFSIHSSESLGTLTFTLLLQGIIYLQLDLVPTVHCMQ